MNIDDLTKKLISGAEMEEAEMYYITERRKTFLKKGRIINGIVKSYRYLITWTLDPKKGHKLEEVEKYIIKQLKRKPLRIVEAYMVMEGDGEETHFHFHTVVRCTKILKKDRFAYYCKKYGFIDIDKTKSDTMEEGINYISKDVLPIKVI